MGDGSGHRGRGVTGRCGGMGECKDGKGGDDVEGGEGGGEGQRQRRG